MRPFFRPFPILLASIMVVFLVHKKTTLSLGADLNSFSSAHASLWIADIEEGQQECRQGNPNKLIVPGPEGYYLQDYEKKLYDFILKRKYDKGLQWCVDKRIRDTGPFVKGSSYGTHPAVRIYYSPRVMYWLTGDPAYWKEGKVKRKKPREGEVPEGGMIVKEMFKQPAKLYQELHKLFDNKIYSQHVRDSLYEDLLSQLITGWAVMVKAPSSSRDGWFWSGIGGLKKGQTIEESIAAQLDNEQHIQSSGIGLAICLRCHASAEKDFTFITRDNIKGEKNTGDILRFFADNSWRDSSYLNQYPLNKIALNESCLADSLVKELLWLPPELRPWVDEEDPEWAKFINSHQPRLDPYVDLENARRLASINPDFAARFSQIKGHFKVKSFPSQWADHVPQGAKKVSHYITSDNCFGCHGGLGGSPPEVAMFVKTGPDYGDGYNISEYGEWRWSPMGLAGRDPVFYAQLESEMRLLGDDDAMKEQVTNTCLSCHGAMGVRQLKLDARKDKTLDSLFKLEYIYLTQQLSAKEKAPDDYRYHKYGELAREGISCTICHHINAPDPADVKKWSPNQPHWIKEETPKELAYFLFHNTTGQYNRGPANELNGPFKDVRTMPMEDVLGITPKQNKFIQNSQLCGSCHTINLPNIDQKFDSANVLNAAEKNPAFKQFNHSIEQATFLEWQNSAFASGKDFQSCQDCHMPNSFQTLDKKINIPQITSKIATIQDASYAAAENEAPEEEIQVPFRSDYRRHEHVGLNVFLLEMFNQFPEVLGVAEKDEMTYATNGNALAIENMVRQAREATVDLNCEVESFRNSNLQVEVGVTNKTGHRFPSGVSFRRAFIEFLVMQGDDVIWGSGRTNSIGVIVDENGIPLQTEFLPDSASHQPHYQTIRRQDQVQIYEELNLNVNHEFTTSFIHRNHNVKDNRLLPRGWRESSYFKDQGEVMVQFMEATDPENVGDDPDYKDPAPHIFSGQDKLLYKIQLPPGTDRSKISIKVSMYYQSIPPYYLNQRFSLVPDGEATQRLFYLTSRLNLEKTAMKDWKLPLVSVEMAYCEKMGKWVEVRLCK